MSCKTKFFLVNKKISQTYTFTRGNSILLLLQNKMFQHFFTGKNLKLSTCFLNTNLIRNQSNNN